MPVHSGEEKVWPKRRLDHRLAVKGGRTRPAESAPHKSWHLLRESVETQRNLRQFLCVFPPGRFDQL